MRTVTTLLLLAVFTVPAFAQNDPSRSYGPTFPPGYFKYGPSWLGSRGSPEEFGHTFGPKRPEMVDTAVTSVAVTQVGNGMAVGLRLWADGPVVGKHEYELRYQVRRHTKKGEEGPILGTAARPKGEGYALKRQRATSEWNGLEAKVDVTRKELSGMTNLPEVKEGTQGVFVRVEPQLIDLTDGKFLTPARTNALFLYLLVGPNREVEQVAPLSDWAAHTARTTPEKLKAVLDDLDAYRVAESGVGMVLGRMLDDKELKAEVKAKIVAALPAANGNDMIGRGRDVFDVLTDLAVSDDADLKVAAKAKMEAVREFNLSKSK
jgi:hypothetical protein